MDYLRKRHHTWQVEVEIPQRLRTKAKAVYGVGRAFTRSLGTHSRPEAERVKHSHIAEFKRRLTELERASAPDPVATEAHQYREALRRAHALGADTEEIEDDLRARAHALGDVERFHSLVAHSALLEECEQWLIEQTQGFTEQTKLRYRRTVAAFIKHSKLVTAREVQAAHAAQYVSWLINKGMARGTINNVVATLGAFWRWLRARGSAIENPWPDLAHLRRKAHKPTRRQQWTDQELVTLLTGRMARCAYLETLHDLVRLDLVTGARLDELCSLRLGDVELRGDGWWITVTEGKTLAAQRTVPVHSAAAHVLQRLTSLEDTNGYLFQTLRPGGPDAKRSWYVTKAFTRYRRHLGLTKPTQVFHSLRNTFMEAMEAAEVPESTVKLLVGHKRASLTFGHYSKGARVQLREAVNKLAYSPEVMAHICCA